MSSDVPDSKQVERERLLVRHLVFDKLSGLLRPVELAIPHSDQGVTHNSDEITAIGTDAYKYSLTWLFEKAQEARVSASDSGRADLVNALEPNQFFSDIQVEFGKKLADLVLAKSSGRPSTAKNVYLKLRNLISPFFDERGVKWPAGDGDVIALIFHVTLHETLNACMAEAALRRAPDPSFVDELPVDGDDEVDDVDVEPKLDQGLAGCSLGDETLSLRLSQAALAAYIWRALAFEVNAFLAKKKVDGYSVANRGAHRLGTDAVLRNFQIKSGVSHVDGIVMGAILLQALLLGGAGKLLSLRRIPSQRDVLRVTLHKPLIDYVDQIVADKKFVPINAPMIAEPMGWGMEHGTAQGAYHQRELSFFKVYRKNLRTRAFLRAVNGEMMGSEPVANGGDQRRQAFKPVFDAVNVCQDTAWRVNSSVWGVVSQLLDWRRRMDSNFAAVEIKRKAVEEKVFPPTTVAMAFKRAIPNAVPVDPKVPEGWVDWLKSDSFDQSRQANGSWMHKGPGALLRDALTRGTIEDAAARERFWFGYQADTRGRIYPLAGTFSPQGHDISRGLLEFADGKKIATQDGCDALAVYGASLVPDDMIRRDLNLASDRLPSLTDRINWVRKVQETLILPSARAPFDQTGWRDLAKRPYLFLAFCFAWKGFVEEGLNYVCHLPVHIDGSCNGLQHLSVLTGSRALAEATNVVPTYVTNGGTLSIRRRDIYSEVATLVASELAQWKTPQFSPNFPTWKKHPESLRMVLCDHASKLLTRDIAKKVVMIIPYGASIKAYGQRLRTGLGKALLQPRRKHQETDAVGTSGLATAFRSEWAAIIQNAGVGVDKQAFEIIQDWSVILAVAFDKVLKSKYPEIGQFQKSLSESIKPVLKQGLPVMWVSPIGVPVIQNRFKDKSITIDNQTLGRIRLTLLEPTDDIDPALQRQGILPNMIHSLDASHLFETIQLAYQSGIKAFSVIHDSYGTHACDVSKLKQCTNSAFVQLYRREDANMGFLHLWMMALSGESEDQEKLFANAWLQSEVPKDRLRLALLNLARQWRRLPAFVSNNLSRTGDQPDPIKGTGSTAPAWLDDVLKAEYFFS